MGVLELFTGRANTAQILVEGTGLKSLCNPINCRGDARKSALGRWPLWFETLASAYDQGF